MVSSLMFPVGKGVILSVFWLAIPWGYILGSPSDVFFLCEKNAVANKKKKKQVRKNNTQTI